MPKSLKRWMERLHFLERTRNAGETMGMISSSLKSLIKNARLAYDDVRQTFIENFLSPAELPKVPADRFSGGIAIVMARGEAADFILTCYE